jgi:uncharacterized protein DUF190
MHLSFDLPIVIEMVDTEAKIEAFLTECRVLLESALVTRERVRALSYRETSKTEETLGLIRSRRHLPRLSGSWVSLRAGGS